MLREIVLFYPEVTRILCYVLEWIEHNNFALFDDSAKHVDFDLNERGKYRFHFYWKAIKEGYKKLTDDSTN